MVLLSVLLMVLVTTARHEGSHAIAAWLQDVPIEEMRLLPGIHPEAGFYFGYVARGDGGNWLIDAAPFGTALAWFALAYWLLRRLPRDAVLRTPLFFVGAASPLVDLVYNYQGGFWREGADVGELFAALPDAAVHAYFIAAIALCILGIRDLQTSRRTGEPHD